MVQEKDSPIVSKKWDFRYLRMAKEIASWSKDPSTQCGAVIVDKDRRPVSWGYNGFPSGIEDTESRLHDRPVKYDLTIHCEINAILQADRSLLKGSTLYTWPFITCHRCAVHVASVGICRVVSVDYAPERWEESFCKAAGIFSVHDPVIELVQYPLDQFENSL